MEKKLFEDLKSATPNYTKTQQLGLTETTNLTSICVINKSSFSLNFQNIFAMKWHQPTLNHAIDRCQ